MHHHRSHARGARPTAARIVLLGLVTLVLAACAGAGATPQETFLVPSSAPSGPAATDEASAGTRLSSPAVIAITQPTAGQQVTGSTVHIVISLTGATIVAATTTNVRPDQGHVHLYVDNNLVSMNYGLEQDLPVNPGTYVLKAEFVASDHAPFNPRVWSPEVFFTVK